jgi:hypothetical protein
MLRSVCLSSLLGVTVHACFAENAPPRALDRDQTHGAEFIEGVTIPSSSEIFTALNKDGKPDWGALFRKEPPTPHRSRPLIALNLGARIADGFLAAEAQGPQQVKNVSMEIKLLAKSLGLEQEFMGRNNSIAAFADSRQWDALDEELEAVQGELAAAMTGQHDDHLVTLMSLGCWLRSVEIASAIVATDYSAEKAKVLRLPGICASYADQLGSMTERIKSTMLIAELQRRLPVLDALLSQPPETPPSEKGVTEMHELTKEMIGLITGPEK